MMLIKIVYIIYCISYKMAKQKLKLLTPPDSDSDEAPIVQAKTVKQTVKQVVPLAKQVVPDSESDDHSQGEGSEEGEFSMEGGEDEMDSALGSESDEEEGLLDFNQKLAEQVKPEKY
jgi:hypothetical protein